MTAIYRWFRALRWRALSRLFAVVASALSLLLYAVSPTLFNNLDEKSRDVVFMFRQSPAPPDQVVIVAVDEKSIKSYGRWPWSRNVQADLISKLKKLNAKIVSLDIIYLSPQNMEQDETLSISLAEAGTPVIGGYFFRDQQTQSANPDSVALLTKSKIGVIRRNNAARLNSVMDFPYVEVNQIAIAQQLQGFGFFNYIPESDGLLRYAPLVLLYKNNYYPSLPLISLARFYGKEISIEFTAEGVHAIRLGGDYPIPVNESGRIALNFYTKNHTIEQISASDILQDQIDTKHIADKLVFVGVTEFGISDVRPTPVDPVFPGVAVHATVAANIMQHYFLYQNNGTMLVDIVLISLVPLLLVWLMARFRRPMLQVAVFFGVLGSLWGLFYYLISYQGWMISFIYPTLAASIGFISFQAYFVLVTQRHTRFLKTAFSSYVSPNLVARLIQRPEELSLTGEKREISVLFSDIRDFTTLSESLSPERLVSIINSYLGPMTDIVMQEQGTLDKYIGDALMAIYNAPLDVDNHAQRAAVSALHMLERLELLNVFFQQEYALQLKIGIGIHTGDAVVGNMGSERRFDYTAMGDTVNLASRLEGRTKAYKINAIISQNTRSQLGPEFICRRLDRILVKGKNKPVDIYELMSAKQNVDAIKLTNLFESALNYYFDADFKSAITQLYRCKTLQENDGPTDVFLHRCHDFLVHPPAADWDGVFVAKEK